MSIKTPPREYFFDSIRALLMLLGVPFHLALIYSSHHWTVNSTEPSAWLTLLHDFIHSFRMQVFFVISGYFSYMLYLRYPPQQWIKLRLSRIAIPMLAAMLLVTLPEFFLIKKFTFEASNWDSLSHYTKYNTVVWNLISHLWFLLVLIILTLLGLLFFKTLDLFVNTKIIQQVQYQPAWKKNIFSFIIFAGAWLLIRRMVLIFYPELLKDGLFNFVVLQTLFYLPFFMLGAIIYKNHKLKSLFLMFNSWVMISFWLLLTVYVINNHYNSANTWLYEIDGFIASLTGLLMVNTMFYIGYSLLNTHSAHINYLVNASLFIYLIHHPLTLMYGFLISPAINNNTLGFFAGLVFVFSLSFILYEFHLRIPLLRFLFSGKLQSIPKKTIIRK